MFELLISESLSLDISEFSLRKPKNWTVVMRNNFVISISIQWIGISHMTNKIWISRPVISTSIYLLGSRELLKQLFFKRRSEKEFWIHRSVSLERFFTISSSDPKSDWYRKRVESNLEYEIRLSMKISANVTITY